jgi:hypothetical protein
MNVSRQRRSEVTPRSSSRVIANDEPTPCRSNVERSRHQPTRRIQASPGKKLQPLETAVRISEVNRIRSCVLIQR